MTEPNRETTFSFTAFTPEGTTDGVMDIESGEIVQLGDQMSPEALELIESFVRAGGEFLSKLDGESDDG